MGSAAASRKVRIDLLFTAAVVSLPAVLPAGFWQEDRDRGAEPVELAESRIDGLAIDAGGGVWLAASTGLYLEKPDGWARLLEGPVRCVHAGADGRIYFARGERVERWDAASGRGEPVARHAPGVAEDIAVAADGTVLVAGPLFDPRAVSILADSPRPARPNLALYSPAGEERKLAQGLASLAVTSAAVDAESRFWIGARAGLFLWSGRGEALRISPPGDDLKLLGESILALECLGDGSVWYCNDLGVMRHDPVSGGWVGMRPDTHGVPFPAGSSLAGDRRGGIWVGGAVGAARRAAGGRWGYYQGPQWLPSDRVLALACTRDGRVLVGTERGLGIIRSRSVSLSGKASHFDAIARRHHINRHGVVWEVPLSREGDLESAGESGYTDNDGLWTSSYVASQCLRYAATGNDEARGLAREAMGALLKLETVTGIPGYPARAVARLNEITGRPGLARWHRAPDGEHVYKGDTSSDEIVGHYFAHALYWDHIAGEDERPSLERRVRELTDHIIQHGFRLVPGDDGEPTRWGVWDPERIGVWGHYWYSSGLYALCILSHLKVAHHITGESRYERQYRTLIRDHGYARRTVDQKVTIPGQVNHSDDQMALFSYYPLLLYERDPELREIYLESLERSWAVERAEGSAAWNFIYNALGQNRRDLARSRRQLEEMPWQLFDWPHDNRRRWDLPLSRWLSGRPRSGRALSMKEYGPYTLVDDPFRLTSGGRGRRALSPAIYLLPYWLGRHHGLLRADE